MLDLNDNLRASFKCLMPQTLHDVIQKTVVQDEFRFLEKASEAEHKVGGKVTGCALNLGELSRESTCTSRS